VRLDLIEAIDLDFTKVPVRIDIRLNSPTPPTSSSIAVKHATLNVLVVISEPKVDELAVAFD